MRDVRQRVFLVAVDADVSGEIEVELLVEDLGLAFVSLLNLALGAKVERKDPLIVDLEQDGECALITDSLAHGQPVAVQSVELRNLHVVFRLRGDCIV